MAQAPVFAVIECPHCDYTVSGQGFGSRVRFDGAYIPGFGEQAAERIHEHSMAVHNKPFPAWRKIDDDD